jgi:hypothetical protein
MRILKHLFVLAFDGVSTHMESLYKYARRRFAHRLKHLFVLAFARAKVCMNTFMGSLQVRMEKCAHCSKQLFVYDFDGVLFAQESSRNHERRSKQLFVDDSDEFTRAGNIAGYIRRKFSQTCASIIRPL